MTFFWGAVIQPTTGAMILAITAEFVIAWVLSFLFSLIFFYFYWKITIFYEDISELFKINNTFEKYENFHETFG